MSKGRFVFYLTYIVAATALACFAPVFVEPRLPFALVFTGCMPLLAVTFVVFMDWHRR